MPRREKHCKVNRNGMVIKSKSLLKTERLIEDNIEVHASCCLYCGDELSPGQIDSYDAERAALALLALFEDGILMDDGMVVKVKEALLALFKDDVFVNSAGMVVKIEEWLKENDDWGDEDYEYIEHDLWDTEHNLNRVGIALLVLFEDGVLINRDGIVVKIKNFLKGTIDSFTECLPCDEHYESQIEGHPVWSDDKSLLKTAEALFDLLLELKDV